MDTIKINRLSDFQIKIKQIISESDNIRISPSTEHLAIHFICGGKKFVAINNPNGENHYCHIDNDDNLIIDIPSRSFRPGQLSYFIEIRENNKYFDDGVKNTLGIEYISTNIEIINPL